MRTNYRPFLLKAVDVTHRCNTLLWGRIKTISNCLLGTLLSKGLPPRGSRKHSRLHSNSPSLNTYTNTSVQNLYYFSTISSINWICSVSANLLNSLDQTASDRCSSPIPKKEGFSLFSDNTPKYHIGFSNVLVPENANVLTSEYRH